MVPDNGGIAGKLDADDTVAVEGGERRMACVVIEAGRLLRIMPKLFAVEGLGCTARLR
jgi:hypothetical protein